MNETTVIQPNFDIDQEITKKNYKAVIEYANMFQRELIHNWQAKDNKGLERLILISRNILNIWLDSIAKKKLWFALVRCGAWVGTLETIEKSIYEKSMDLWSRKRLYKNISSIKHLAEIVQLLEVKGVMTHSEMAKELNLNHYSTLTEIIKKVANLELIDVRKAGKYSLYSLTDAGVRYAKQIRAGEDRQVLLKNIINEYELQINEELLDEYLQSVNKGLLIKQGQALKVKIDSEKMQDVNVAAIYKYESYDEEKNVLSFKTTKKAEREKLINYEMEA